MMQYEELISRAESLPFISDYESADAAVKAVAGMIASKLDPAHAEMLADQLPSPLTVEKLRGNQQTETMPQSAEEALIGLGDQFGLDFDESEDLARTVIDCLTETMDEGLFMELADSLPEDWKGLLTIH